MSEWVDRFSAAYKRLSPIARGTLYSSIDGARSEIVSNFPSLRFLKESRPSESSQNLVLWHWGTEIATEDSFNAAVTYLEESTDHPIFTRTYTIRRDAYESFPTLPCGSSLESLTAVVLTASGIDYTFAQVTSNNGATFLPIIEGGAIVSLVMTAQGTATTTPPVITISGDGTGATATAIVQPQDSILVSQRKDELPADDPRSSDYVRVIRTYKTLPGPILSGSVITPTGAIGTQTQQQVLAGTLVSPGFGVLSDDVTPIDATTATRKRTTVKNYPELDGQENATTNRTLMRHTSSTARYTKKQRVPSVDSNGHPTQPPQGFLVIESSLTPVNQHESDLSVTTVDAFDELISKDASDKSANYAPTVTTETIVSIDTPPKAYDDPGNEDMLESRIEAVDSQRSLSVIKRLEPGVNYPIIRVEHEFIEALNTTGVVTYTMDVGMQPSLLGVEGSSSRLVSSKVQDLGNGKSLRIDVMVVTVDDKISWHTDAWTGQYTRVLEMRVNPNYAPRNAGRGISYEMDNRGSYAILKTFTHAIPGPETEYKVMHLALPQVFTGYMLFKATADAAQWQVNSQYQRRCSRQVSARVVTIHTFAPEQYRQIPIETSFQEAEWNEPGFTGAGLTDGQSITLPYGYIYIPGSSSSSQGYTIHLPKGVPGASAWLARVGREVLHQHNESIVERIPGLYRVELTYVTIPAVDSGTISGYYTPSA